MNLNIVDYALNYIDCTILSDNILWRATSIYGFPFNHQKLLTCNLISDLRQTTSNNNWLIFGDFNIVLNSNEKMGGNPVDYNITNNFRSTLDNCNLNDLGYQGNIFTWHNRQEDNHYIQARLDRFCATDDWIYNFSYYHNTHLLRYSSDHCHILLDFSTNNPDRQTQNHHHSKRFEQMWTKDDEIINIITEAWQGQNLNLQKKLETTLDKMHHWGQNKFGTLPRKIKKAQADLQRINDNIQNGNLMSMVRSKEKELDDLLHSEEMWWNQRSRVLWLKHGDKNTSFFHHKASQRRRKNRIEAISDRTGEVHTKQEEIEETLIEHFKDLFKSQDTRHIIPTVEVVKNTITEAMFEHLNAPFTREEVKNAIKDMKGLAAPGPDGLPAIFYQTYWDIVGHEVTDAALQVLNNGESPKPYNHTHICLIPKKNNPTNPSDYRPIALCNVTLKIITKTISNRLKEILPELISSNQSAFVPGRLVTDNTLVAYEVFHHFQHSTSKKGFMGVKTDMAKAYDRVEWQFLQTTLESMGFPHQLTDTILECVSTVSFSILVNGKPSHQFTPQRGLRQGYPLSPYLFIICANVLSGLITKAQNLRKIHGIKVAHGAPEVSHLLFADGSLFFCRAAKEEAQEIKNLITEYQEASGKLVNMDKSEIMFSKHTNQQV
jgi:hypothetical protein